MNEHNSCLIWRYAYQCCCPLAGKHTQYSRVPHNTTFAFLKNKHHSLDDGALLGDSGYACSPFLMTLYTVTRNTAQEAYNHAHAKTRVVIEQTFGWWKRRFHVLHAEIRMAPEKVCMIVGACAVLHHIALWLQKANGGWRGRCAGRCGSLPWTPTRSVIEGPHLHLSDMFWVTFLVCCEHKVLKFIRLTLNPELFIYGRCYLFD